MKSHKLDLVNFQVNKIDINVWKKNCVIFSFFI